MIAAGSREQSTESGPLRVSVRVQPGARSEQVGGRYGSGEPPVLVVRVRAPAVDGRANAALCGLLASAFGVPNKSVRIRSGTASRSKQVDVDGGDPKVLEALLGRS